MLKKLIRCGSLILVLIVALRVAGFADTIEGRVAHANSAALDVIVYDAQGRPYPHTLRLDVDDATRVSGIAVISDLRPNDALSADIHQTESGAWHADSVRLFQEINAQPATKKPSPSLKDVLGNPVVRGALTGAATGAIASSLSHGKAGKGALVGAGVGAAAGLLEGLFSRPSKDSSDSDNR